MHTVLVPYSEQSALKPLPIDKFNSLCLDQDVELDEDFIDPLLTGRLDGDEYTYEPTPVIAAISHAARLLRRAPGKPLASTPIADLSPFERDTPATYLANIINSSLEPATVIDANYTSTSRRHSIAACYMAEAYFSWTIKALKNFYGSSYHPNYGCDVVLDDSDQAIFLRKNAGDARSSLALRPYTVNGVIYPAGSIARVEIDRDYQSLDCKSDYGEPVEPYIPARSLRVIPASEVTWVGFKRISAFALPSEERPIFSESFEACYDDETCRSIRQTTVDTIAAIAANACAVLDETDINY